MALAKCTGELPTELAAARDAMLVAHAAYLEAREVQTAYSEKPSAYTRDGAMRRIVRLDRDG